MKFKLAACVILTSLAVLPGVSGAKGCLKGAAVGGVGGHFAGHHGLIGAAAGCAVGHHMATKRDKAAAQAAQPTNVSPATAQPVAAPTKP